MTGLSSSQMIAEIKTAIADGTLPYAEMKRRLNAAIDAELSKTTEAADLELVQACQGLLWDIHMQGASWEGRTEQSLENAKRKLNRRLKAQGIRKYALRTVAAAAALLLIAFAAEVLIHREWLDGNSTLDEQDYVVKSNVVDPNMVESGTAAVNDSFRMVESTDFDEACSILSFQPAMPTWIPDGWKIVRFQSQCLDGLEDFYVSYQNPQNEKHMKFEIHFSRNLDIGLGMYAEQNKSGKTITLNNGLSVYLSLNLEIPVCTWTTSNTVYLLSGPFTEAELIKIMNSI